MKLKQLINQYVTFRQSLGERFHTNECILKSFSRAMGYDIDVNDIQSDKVSTFLYGAGPLTSSWHIKHNALLGFYRYIISRGYVSHSPLPVTLPKRPQPFVPYIYTLEELRRLLAASFTYQKNRGRLEPYMIRSLLLILYGAGLRLTEALSLKIADVDLSQAVVTIHESKFFKTRLVPIGSQLVQEMDKYFKWRKQKGYSQNTDSLFFIGRNGKVVNRDTFEQSFQRIRTKAGIKRTDGARYQPRLHDLRHTFAVHRLTTWYQQGANVQELLPLLSVYLGHKYLSATSIYLSMTPQLLQEAGARFEQYAIKGGKR